MKTVIEMVQSGSWAGLSGHFYKGKNKVSRHATLIAVWWKVHRRRLDDSNTPSSGQYSLPDKIISC